MERDTFRYVGDFREWGHGRPDGPSIRAAVRAAPGEDEPELLRYLRGGALLYATPSAVPDVLGPAGAVIGGLHLFTDGRWLWFSDLAHYVERHHVVLDPDFLAHARGNGWVVPVLDDDDLQAVPAAILAGGAG
ncbi:hypothetical protein [Kitasatospora phosalacinea]|uniref:Uncharacterized protein n=1 Tax=Kitasatospora phosalacinea TaxID=2065 RepID=A0A9W6ULJ1_9ACTN|nr:hypothetical protein [Kitasatospora phosalacinea]GLW54476.1 hypothetical protein Kpho01_24870 [Kitasatospora phosalacinea]